MALTRNFIVCSVLVYCASAVTVIPLTLNLPKPYENPVRPAKSDSEILQNLHASTKLDNLVWSSSLWTPGTKYLNSINESRGIYASHDSFVRGAIDASATHQHLVIQPQDVWLTILKQISSYLRKHKDDKDVSEKWDNLDGNLDAISGIHPLMVNLIDGWMGIQFGQRDKTNWLLDWVRPNVGTLARSSLLINATDEDMIAKALMMASSTKATEDLPAFPCENGIPSITLLGTRADWTTISDKLDPLIRLKFGKEPGLYGAMLRPILSRFIETFDKPNDLGVRQFWSDIVTLTPKQKLCRTTDLVTGWINAFHYWDGAGSLVNNADPSLNNPSSASKPREQMQSDALVLDNITYPWRHRKDLPTSYSHTTMCMGGDTPGWRRSQLLVGMLAKSVKKGIPEGYEQAMKQVGFKLPSSVKESDHSILKPLPAYIYHDDAGDSVCSYPVFTFSTL
jgi:hypothetical protein